jgi:hypothetical protein
MGRNWFDHDGAGPPAASPNPPFITAPPTVTAAEGDTITITATADDADGDILTISATGFPSSLTFASTPGPPAVDATLSGTLGYDDAGSYTITWIVSDGPCGNIATVVTTLTITNTDRPPEVFAPLSLQCDPGIRVTIDISALDPDKDPIGSLQADLTHLPQTGGAIFGPTGQGKARLTWTPTAYDAGFTYPVHFYASNQMTGQATTQLVVSNANPPTGVEVERAPPTVFGLGQNRPNPFNPSTEIGFSLPQAGHVRLSVHGLDGRMVAILWDGPKGAGKHTVQWNGLDARGRSVGSGVYYYRLEADGFNASKRMVLLR